jgi:hypothetical protein
MHPSKCGNSMKPFLVDSVRQLVEVPRDVEVLEQLSVAVREHRVLFCLG